MTGCLDAVLHYWRARPPVRLALVCAYGSFAIPVSQLASLEGGAGVRAVARRLNVSGPFITAQVNLLVKANLVAKHPNPEDGRGVSLRLTEQGEAQLEAMAPEMQRANDTFFGSLSVEDFRSLSEIVARLEASTELAVRTPAD